MKWRGERGEGPAKGITREGGREREGGGMIVHRFFLKSEITILVFAVGGNYFWPCVFLLW